VKLWDVQTGGVIKTFCGHASDVYSVSISPDSITLASGYKDNSICLWNVQMGECFCVISGNSGSINSLSFFPTNSQRLISASSDHTIQQWDIDGIAFSPDGTHFVSWRGHTATVQVSESGVITTKLQVSDDDLDYCCFSPSGEFIAGSVDHDVYVWDITHTNPYLFKTLIGHTNTISGLVFSSSIISVCRDKAVKFWQIGASPTGPVTTDKMSTLPTPASIQSVSLQAREGIAISSDSAGVVKTWDISTGFCSASFQTPAKGETSRDAQLIEGKLILIWGDAENKIHIWDTEKDELLQTGKIPCIEGLRMSGDGSQIFCLTAGKVQSWSIQTREAVGSVEFRGVSKFMDPLHTDGSRIWICFRDLTIEGWDFGISGSSPIPLSGAFPNRPHLNFVYKPEWGSDTGPSVIENAVTGKSFFHLGRYAKPRDARWDGRYLVAGYEFGELLILDSHYVSPQ